MSRDKLATSKSTQLSTKSWVKLLLLLENALKLNFEALPLSENLNPLQGPTHTLTPSSINTQNRSKKLRIDLSWHVLNSMILVKLYHTEKQGFGFENKFHTHPPKLLKLHEPSFRKVSLLPAKLHMLFSAYLWVREFWPQI